MHNSKDMEPINDREDSDALNEMLRITTRIIEAAAPPESYWPGYHARLREKLNQTHAPYVAITDKPWWITRFFRASVSVPVPVAAALILLFAFSLFFFSRTPEPNAPQVQVVQVPVEVPVVQKETVTRVVYLRTPRRNKQRLNSPPDDSTLAKTLVGFKPTEEIKLTVIKGGTANEK